MKEEAGNAAPSRDLSLDPHLSRTRLSLEASKVPSGQTEVALALRAGRECLTCLILVPALLSSLQLVFREKKDMQIQRDFFFFGLSHMINKVQNAAAFWPEAEVPHYFSSPWCLHL